MKVAEILSIMVSILLVERARATLAPLGGHQSVFSSSSAPSTLWRPATPTLCTKLLGDCHDCDERETTSVLLVNGGTPPMVLITVFLSTTSILAPCCCLNIWFIQHWFWKLFTMSLLVEGCKSLSLQEFFRVWESPHR